MIPQAISPHETAANKSSNRLVSFSSLDNISLSGEESLIPTQFTTPRSPLFTVSDAL
jgi:hypothetical protein